MPPPIHPTIRLPNEHCDSQKEVDAKLYFWNPTTITQINSIYVE